MSDLLHALQQIATPLLFVSLLFSVLLLLLPQRHSPNGRTPHIVVLVLGDIGRSPRMQYHALSIARNGGKVSLVCYGGTDPRPELSADSNITTLPLPSPPRWMDTSTPMKFILLSPFKALFQLSALLYCLMYLVPSSAGCILLQNPPSIPTMVAAALVSRLRNQRVIIDWHNFGWSILALKLKEHPLVQVAKLYEYLFARTASAHFTVTNAFTSYLSKHWSLPASSIHTLHDRPPSHFRPLTSTERAAFLSTHPDTASFAENILTGATKLLVTSTSWTADEDFPMLIDALAARDRAVSAQTFLNPKDPVARILLIVTGKGPLRDPYMLQIEELELQYTAVKSAWLEAEDYPKMVGSADLGISLHSSSSGIDLPMKVVDLFGCGVPVAALRFRALGELVKDGVNGVSFTDCKELEGVLERLSSPAGEKELAKLKDGAVAEAKEENRWDANWDRVAKKVLGL